MKNNTVSKVISLISRYIPANRILIDEPMSKHTSFRIGGPADAMVIVNTEKELFKVLKAIDEINYHRSNGVAPYMIIGNGSNLLVSDKGYSGIIITLGRDEESDFGKISIISSKEESEESGKTVVRVGAAKLLSGVSAFLADNALTGFEFASGIPGSIGGAVCMNAGAYGGEMKDVVKNVRAINSWLEIPLFQMSELTPELVEKHHSRLCFHLEDFPNSRMRFGYRQSCAQTEHLAILSVDLELAKGNPEEIEARISELREKRNSKQPIEFPSAGSTFKRPAQGYAAALIEEAGLKGYTVGGAMVSEKHAGFIINTGNATCEDVLGVMKHIRAEVFARTGIKLEPEVKLVGDFR